MKMAAGVLCIVYMIWIMTVTQSCNVFAVGFTHKRIRKAVKQYLDGFREPYNWRIDAVYDSLYLIIFIKSES